MLVRDECGVLLARVAHDLNYLLYLLHVVHPLEQALLGHQLSEDAPYGPDIQSLRVVLLIQHDFRGTIPPCDDVNCLLGGRRVVSIAEASGQPEIANLQVSVHVDKYIRWLEVPVHYVGRVQVQHSSKQLIHEILVVLIGKLLLRIDEFVHVGLHQLRNYVHVVIAGGGWWALDVQKRDDVLVVEKLYKMVKLVSLGFLLRILISRRTLLASTRSWKAFGIFLMATLV